MKTKFHGKEYFVIDTDDTANPSKKIRMLFETEEDMRNFNAYAIIENNEVYKDGKLIGYWHDQFYTRKKKITTKSSIEGQKKFNQLKKRKLSGDERTIMEMYGYVPKSPVQVERMLSEIRKYKIGKKLADKVEK